MNSPYRVLIADDHPVVLEGIRTLLSSDTSLEVIGEASTGKEVLRLVEIHRPDVLVLDIGMPEGRGVDVLETFRRTLPEMKIVIHTVHTSARYVHDCIIGGVRGYVAKGDKHADLLKAVLSVLDGKLYLGPSIGQTVVNGYLAAASARLTGDPPRENLTPRECDIIRLSARGLRAKEIAGRLSLSIKTVQNHRYRVMKKLGLRNTSALINYALENGLVEQADSEDGTDTESASTGARILGG